MISNWFGPKVKGTAMSIGMLGSGAGALVWVNFISKIIAGSGWRTAYLANGRCKCPDDPDRIDFSCKYAK